MVCYVDHIMSYCCFWLHMFNCTCLYIKKKNAEFLWFMARKVLFIKTINHFKKKNIIQSAYRFFFLTLFTFESNNTKTEYTILKYLNQSSYLLSCNRICDDMMYIYMTDHTIFRRYVGDIHQSNCIQYTQQDNLWFTTFKLYDILCMYFLGIISFKKLLLLCILCEYLHGCVGFLSSKLPIQLFPSQNAP